MSMLRRLADPELRRFARYAALRPRLWRIERPRASTPPYLSPVARLPFPVAPEPSAPWNQTFTDLEAEARLHRFAWQFDDDDVRSWIASHPAPSDREAWQPYTVSERLANWIRAGHPREEHVRASMSLQADYLLRNLEHYGPRWTGNHLSNNGRALFLAGRALEREDLINAGRTILLNEIPRLFEHDGFLREDSSHYQFLVTSHYLDVLPDEPMVAKMREACAFFVVGNQMPLIGDISPDTSPESLTHVASGAKKSGVFGEWGRLDRGRWTVFAHVNRHGYVFQPGHGHNDTGGIVAFRDGEPVVVDCGRFHYVDDEVGRHGVSAWSHSILLVDGLEPGLTQQWYLATEYLKRRSGGAPRLSQIDNMLTIEHRGFARSRGAGLHRRNVAIDNDALRVEDVVEGSGVHRISLVFHLAQGDVALPEGFARTEPRDEKLGWRVTRYAHREPVRSIVAEANVTLPWKGISVIR